MNFVSKSNSPIFSLKLLQFCHILIPLSIITNYPDFSILEIKNGDIHSFSVKISVYEKNNIQ